MLKIINDARRNLAGAAVLGVAALASTGAMAETNYLANPNFATPGPNGSSSTCGYEQVCPAAAASWVEGTYYEQGLTSGSITTELLPSSLIKGTTMMHVQLDGVAGDITQTFNTGLAAKKTVYACVWLYISASEPFDVGIYAGTYPDPVEGGAIMAEAGHWEVVNVTATPDPKLGAASQIVIYGGAIGEQVDFYLQTASVSTSPQQCKAQ